MTESRSVICNLTKKIVTRVYARTGSQFMRTGSQITRATFFVKSQFAVLGIHFFDDEENEFRVVAGNVKRIETSARITSMKSKSSAAEAIGRTKKKRKKEERIERKGRK